MFTYKLKLKGSYPLKDEENGYITFYDKKTDDIIGWIEPPNMNDASGKAYSEKIEIDIVEEESSEDEKPFSEEEPEMLNREKEAEQQAETAEPEEKSEGDGKEIPEEEEESTQVSQTEKEQKTGTEKSRKEQTTSNSDAYVLTMTVDESYLKGNNRKYPITIDPTIQWAGDSKLRDAYVISGAKYKNNNYYNGGTTIMPAGHGSYGTYRTYMQLIGLESVVRGQSIASASLDVYGAGQSSAAGNQAIAISKVTSSWNPTTIKWTKQPSFSSAIISTVTAGKTKHKKYTYNILSYVKEVAAGGANYGIVFRNTTSSPKYMSFVGSRSSTGYKPTLKVTYYSVPTAPTSVAFSSDVSTGKNITIDYTGISSDGLKQVYTTNCRNIRRETG